MTTQYPWDPFATPPRKRRQPVFLHSPMSFSALNADKQRHRVRKAGNENAQKNAILPRPSGSRRIKRQETVMYDDGRAQQRVVVQVVSHDGSRPPVKQNDGLGGGERSETRYKYKRRTHNARSVRSKRGQTTNKRRQKPGWRLYRRCDGGVTGL